jgi:quercetin dioxygenase-like cupin family protein
MLWRQHAFHAFACALLLAGAAAAEPLEPARLNPAELKWTVLPSGISRAYVAGDDKKLGAYAYVSRIPAGLKLMPHWHPDDRVVTVLSGTMRVGYGEQFDEAAMKELPAGSFWTEPAKQAHYTWAKDGEVTIYVVGTGPSGSTQIPEKK